MDTQNNAPVLTEEERERQEIEKINSLFDKIDAKLSQPESGLDDAAKDKIMENADSVIESYKSGSMQAEEAFQKLEAILQSIPEKKPEESAEQKRLDLIDKLSRGVPVDHREILAVAQGVGVEIDELLDSDKIIIKKLEAVAKKNPEASHIETAEISEEDTERKIHDMELRVINLTNLARIERNRGNEARAHEHDEERRVLQEQLDLHRLQPETTPEAPATPEAIDTDHLKNLAEKMNQRGAVFGREINLEEADRRAAMEAIELAKGSIEMKKNDPQWEKLNDAIRELGDKGVIMSFVFPPTWLVNAGDAEEVSTGRDENNLYRIRVPASIYELYIEDETLKKLSEDFSYSNETLRGRSAKHTGKDIAFLLKTLEKNGVIDSPKTAAEEFITPENGPEMEKLRRLCDEVVREKENMLAVATEEGRARLEDIHEEINQILAAAMVGTPSGEATKRLEELRQEIQTVEKEGVPGTSVTQEALDLIATDRESRAAGRLGAALSDRTIQRIARENGIELPMSAVTQDLVSQLNEKIKEKTPEVPQADLFSETGVRAPDSQDLIGKLNQRWLAGNETMSDEDFLCIPKINELARTIAERPLFVEGAETIDMEGILQNVLRDMEEDESISPKAALRYLQSELPIAVTGYEGAEVLTEKNEEGRKETAGEIEKIQNVFDLSEKYPDLTKAEVERLAKLRRLSELRLLIKKAEKRQDEPEVLKLEAELHQLEDEILPNGTPEEIEEQLQKDLAISRGESVEPAQEIIFPEKESLEDIPMTSDIEAQFEKDFALAQKDLEEVVTVIENPDGTKKTLRFSDLPEGRKKLLLLNLKGFAVENAKAQALKNFTEEEKERYDSAGILKKVWLGFSKTFRRASNIAQMEQGTLQQPEYNKGVYIEVMKSMLEMASNGPEAIETGEGKDKQIQFNFAMPEDFSGTPEELAVRENFNNAAGKFANISAEWAFSSNEAEQKKYKEASDEYAKARRELLKTKFTDSEFNAQSYVADLDTRVQFTQVFNTYPEAEKDFAEMVGSNKSLLKGLRAAFKERARLMLMGTATRTIAVAGAGAALGALGLGGGMLAIPVAMIAGGAVGGVAGWYGAGKRTEQNIKDTKALMEMGKDDITAAKDLYQFQQKTYDYNKEKNEFTEKVGGEKTREELQDAEQLVGKLQLAIERANGRTVAMNGEVPMKHGQTKERLMEILGERLYYTEQKLSKELVSFGEGAEAAKNRYELFRALAQARTMFEMNEPAMNTTKIFRRKDKTEIGTIKNKIDELLGTQEKRIGSKEKEMLDKAKRNGAIMGASVGAASGLLVSSLSWYHNTHAAEVPSGTTTPKGGTAPGTHTPPGTEVTPPRVAIDEAMNQIRQPHTVASGENVWNIMKIRLSDNELFSKLSPRQQYFIIDSLKDRIAHLSPSQLQEIGIKSGDPNRIYPGDTLHFEKIFKDSDILMRAFNRVGNVHEAVASTEVTAPTETHEAGFVDNIKNLFKENASPEQNNTGTQHHAADSATHQHAHQQTHTGNHADTGHTEPEPHHEPTAPETPPVPETPVTPETTTPWPPRYTASFNQWVNRHLPEGTDLKKYDFLYNSRIRDQIAAGRSEDVMRVGTEINRAIGLGAFRTDSLAPKETWASYIFRQINASGRKAPDIDLDRLFRGGGATETASSPVGGPGMPPPYMDRAAGYYAEMNARRAAEAQMEWHRRMMYGPYAGPPYRPYGYGYYRPYYGPTIFDGIFGGHHHRR